MTTINLSKKGIVLTLLITLLLAISGCKSKKVSIVNGSGALKAKSEEQVLEDILTHELNYNTITTKGKVSFNGKEITTIFKLVKDEYIQASVRPLLGIEAMRMDISPEKIVIIDRLGGQYAEMKLDGSDASNSIAFNFYNLQALLTNQLFLAGNQKVTKLNNTDYEISASNDHYILQTKDKNNLKYNFSVDASNRITQTIISSDAHDLSLAWAYSEFVEDKGAIYPTNMLADVKFKKQKVKVGISYSTLDIDTNFNIDKSISSRYKKVEIRDLIETYMKLK